MTVNSGGPKPTTRTSRNRVLRMALKMFCESGYQAVSLRKLAMEIGIQAGSLYNHIENKQALLFELIEKYETGLAQVLGKASTRNYVHYELEDFIRRYIMFIQRHRFRCRLSKSEFRFLSPAQQDEIRLVRAKVSTQLETIIGRGINNGWFENVPIAATANRILSMLNEVATWHATDYQLSQAEVVNMHIRFAKGYLMAPQVALSR